MTGEQRCPRCGLVLSAHNYLRCPRCHQLLITAGCGGSCAQCSGGKKCLSEDVT